ncbi:MAG: hypothetical protein KF787_08455 [Phycisphaeraceae bacterium]|nr:hypothetical protein [Phycisphaerae bacterium]MBX3392666.1 hypothetical protein [Phycisphaeraceae bacterium]HRJ50575.1 hypothetical protein [Phycisphaerales bacterium]
MIDTIIIAGIIAVVAIIIVAVVLAERARKKALAAVAESLGFSVDFNPDPSARVNAYAALGRPWSDLRKGPEGVQWCMAGTLSGRYVTLVQHRYTTGSGKSRQIHDHAVVATPAPELWPTVTLTRENLFHKIGALVGSRDLQLEDADFNRRWRVASDNEDFSLLALTPEIQGWSMSLPKDSVVRFGGGAITVARRISVGARDIPALVESCARLADLIPGELDHWTPA